ncbi:MAG: FHA domain-containing protein [Nitrososphaerales archaeon]
MEQKDEVIVLKLKEKNSGQTIELKSGDVVGRYSVDFFQKMNNYKLISRLHFQVLYKEGKWFIRDLESTNGTFLNTKKLEPDKDYEIKKGDVINIAGIVDFIVQ